MTNINFQCPYCNKPTTITDPNQFRHWQKIQIEDSDKGDVGLNILAITCPNNKCKKLFLEMSLVKAKHYRTQFASGWKPEKILKKWQLLPESQAKPLPEYVPKAIQEDYYEACLIRDLSPKASATLSRRCLQGMIRDFWKIKKPNLKYEIDALEEKVDLLTWTAIDAVRSVGNIGAHMEKDINIIIDVEPNEAQLLIELIEQLIDDWYVERHNRKERLDRITRMSDKKSNKEEK